MPMRKGKPVKFILISILIHLGILSGIDVLPIPTRVIPKEPPVIPVQTVLIEEETEEGFAPGEPVLAKTGFSKDALVAKAQTAKGTRGLHPIEDFPGPIPRQGSFEPSVNVQKSPTPGVLPPGQKGKGVESRRAVRPSVSPSLELPAVRPSASDQALPLPMEEPKTLTEAKEGGIPVYSETLEKSSAPLGRNRPHPEFVPDLPPIPTVESPVLPEEKEMVLAQRGSPELEANTSSPLSPSRESKKVRTSLGQGPRIKPLSEKLGAFDPLIEGLQDEGAFVEAGQGFSVVLLLDTSGSVKGQPLEGIKRSAIEFVSLMRDMDRCAVMTFNDAAGLLVSFTSNKDRIKREIRELRVEGQNTVLFDALDRAVLLLKAEEDNKRFVVLFSDGKDEGSQSTLDEVIKRARGSQISIFSVGYSRVEKTHLTNLEGLSARTGGIFAEAPHFQEIVELFKAARKHKKKKEV